ncbi:hypothetical protein EDB85DRAFT_654433 [Lactarius pseudohatsudake]|nr:hypothetical protein EDB85DRAFT_654433 [Lactarius pseudohatsudake]
MIPVPALPTHYSSSYSPNLQLRHGPRNLSPAHRLLHVRRPRPPRDLSPAPHLHSRRVQPTRRATPTRRSPPRLQRHARAPRERGRAHRARVYRAAPRAAARTDGPRAHPGIRDRCCGAERAQHARALVVRRPRWRRGRRDARGGQAYALRPALAGDRDAPAARRARDDRNGVCRRRSRHQARLVHCDRSARMAPGVSRLILNSSFVPRVSWAVHMSRSAVLYFGAFHRIHCLLRGSGALQGGRKEAPQEALVGKRDAGNLETMCSKPYGS